MGRAREREGEVSLAQQMSEEETPLAPGEERFFCPYPGCKRSFAELWRLKVRALGRRELACSRDLARREQDAPFVERGRERELILFCAAARPLFPRN